MVQIPIGYVGVVISYVGKAHVDVSGLEFKHGDLVEQGHKGVWVTPLYPGKQPLNTRVMKVELVPTTNIVLNWASRTEAHHYDEKLSSITVRSRDGFAFNLDVSQIIHVGALDAPKVISRVGSMQNLVDHVLQPIVGNYFRNSAQDCTVLDFLSARSQRQTEAAEHIRVALAAYDVQQRQSGHRGWFAGPDAAQAGQRATEVRRRFAGQTTRGVRAQARTPFPNKRAGDSCGNLDDFLADGKRHRLAMFLEAGQIPGHGVLDVGQRFRSRLALRDAARQ
jgi:uncharacterized membrane protein YqiK